MRQRAEAVDLQLKDELIGVERIRSAGKPQGPQGSREHTSIIKGHIFRRAVAAPEPTRTRVPQGTHTEQYSPKRHTFAMTCRNPIIEAQPQTDLLLTSNHHNRIGAEKRQLRESFAG